MTVKDYIQGYFEDNIFSDNNINFVLKKHDIEDGSIDVDLISEKQKDLSIADLHLILANRLNGDGEEIARGDFSIKDRSVTMTNDDREYHRRIANQLYKKWGEPTQEVISEKHYTIGII